MRFDHMLGITSEKLVRTFARKDDFDTLAGLARHDEDREIRRLSDRAPRWRESCGSSEARSFELISIGV